VFENVIKGYTKETYESENTNDRAIWRKWGEMDSLLKKLKKQKQPELTKYVESYIEVKEKAKKENEKNAEAYEKEQKLKEKEERRNREIENAKRRREEEKRRLEILEAEKRGKGWKISFKDDGWGFM
jgi:organic radical activating enzyme